MDAKLKLLFAAGVTALLATPFVLNAHAFPGGGKGGKGGEHFIEMMDADGDGSVTQAEIDAKHAEKFAEFDANKDGKLSADEFAALEEARRKERHKAHFERMDADGDNAVSADEFGSRSSKMFERFDKNGDGKLTADEMPKRGKGGKGHRCKD